MCDNLSAEQQQQFREMDVESQARIVFRFLKDEHRSNTGCYEDGRYKEYYSTESLREAIFSSRKTTKQSNRDYGMVLEAIILLERWGLVVRDCPYPLNTKGAKNSYMVYLTSIGIKSDFHDGVLLLVDKPEEIVGALEQKVGDLDEVVRQYYLESLRAYQEGLYISSVICLGAASERAILWLAESIESFCSKYQQPIQKRRRNISDLTKYLSGSILSDIFPNDATFETELRKRLVLLGDLYRENRNEAGHPKTVDQSWLGEDQEILLIHFRRYITTICEAIGRII